MSDFFIRITLSGILSGIIGLERERRSKDAGLKTHFLVGIGSALMMIVSLYTFHDSRVAAQVVSGISFLGAGTIILEKHYVKGLTTAAGIWTTSGIGLAIGSGMYTLGIFSTTLVLAGLEILDRIFKNTSSKYLYINIWVRPEELINLSKKIDDNSFSIIEYKTERIEYNGDENVMFVDLKLKIPNKKDYYKLMDNLYKNIEILKIKIL
ncbi:MgtC/SapB family protein [Clostridium guangxiense]|uniref:MgtC/SapB family protein n=1 Tax=Clostridium guangxiense TaxID=1662055 RepID=UPI001E2FB473|nr:MgtC/SapB family protein [Clostridium guangxiense]MCD2348775.1 MgtC/SapB family protein [Clostridium guangxiense]